jgi:hypothetical protein
MTPALQDLLTTRLPFPGLAAWSVRLEDRSPASECFVNWLAPAQVEQALARVALAADSLAQQNLKPSRLCWVFEHLRIYLAVRPDQTCLALFLENRPELPAATAEGVLEAFATLPSV